MRTNSRPGAEHRQETFIRRLRHAARTAMPERVRGWWRAWVFTLFFWGHVYLLQWFVSVYLRAQVLAPRDFSSPWVRALLVDTPLLNNLLALLLVFLLVLRFKRSNWRALRWRWPGFLKSVKLRGGRRLPLAAAACFLLGVLLLILSRFLVRWLEPGVVTALDELMNRSAVVARSLSVVAVLTAPLSEEVLYRGVLYRGLVRGWGKWCAAVLSGLIFFAIHWPMYAWAGRLSVLLLSSACSVVLVYTSRLSLSLLTHLGFNCAMAVLVFLG